MQARNDETSRTRRCIAEAWLGDTSARRALATRLTPIIRATVQRHGRRGMGALRLEPSDVAQEIWVALLRDEMRKLRQWEPSRGLSLEAFVAMIARREILTLCSATRRVNRLEWSDDGELERAIERDTPEQLLLGRRALAGLAQRIARALPVRGQAVFSCLYLDHQSPEEAALTLRVERQVVYNWQHRIRALLARDESAKRTARVLQ